MLRVGASFAFGLNVSRREKEPAKFDWRGPIISLVNMIALETTAANDNLALRQSANIEACDCLQWLGPSMSGLDTDEEVELPRVAANTQSEIRLTYTSNWGTSK
jgi:hypothetical protein